MNTITIDLDSLSPEIAEKLAGFLLAYAGAEETEDQRAEVYRQANDELNRSILSAREILEPTPAEVFAQPISTTSPTVIHSPMTISSAGPTLVIPNPPQPAAVPATQIPSGSAPAPVTAVGVIVDKSGLPWDSRIHSSAKSFNADGTWRARRGLAEGIVPQVESELRQLMAIPSPQNAPGTVVPAPITAANIPLPPATASPSIQPYLDLMNKVSSALAGGRITSPQLQKVCDAVGLPTFVSLGTRLDLVPAVAPMIEGILAGTAV